MTKSMGRTASILGLLLSLLSSASSAAQELRGTVTQPDGATPASGIIVVLLDGNRDTVVARTVTGERGNYLIRAPKSMTVRLQLLRLGSRPTLVGSFNLEVGSTRDQNVTLQNNPIALAKFDVKANGGCAVRPDTGLLVAQLYEEARKALMASSTSISGTTSIASFTRYTRNEDLKGKLTASVQRTVITGPTSKPFVSLSADSLAKVGYVSTESDGSTYRAPDAEVLFSETFLSSHCLQLVASDDKHRKSVGIEFHAPNRNKKLIDVKGIIWLDKESNELQSVDFDYDGVAREYTRNKVGGLVEFTHMDNGLWFVNKWSITMPQISLQRTAGYSASGSANNAQSEEVLSGLQIIGGSVQSVKMNGEVLYASSDVSFLEGDAPKVAVTNTRDIPAVAKAAPAAGYSVDSTSAESSCGAAVDNRHTGSAQGRVIDDARHNVAGAMVSAEWKEDFEVRTGTTLQWQQRRLTTMSLPDGSYTVCGLPANRPVTLMAAQGETSSRSATVRVSEGHPRTTMELSMRTPLIVVANSRTTLVRVVDALEQPIPHALIALNGGTQRVTDEDGVATLNIGNADSANMLVRRIGYKQFDGYATRATKTEPLTVHMSPTSQTLRTVNVTARERSPLERTGFYDRVRDIQRGAISGEFFTPEQLEQRAATRASQILMSSKFARVEVERGFGQPSMGGGVAYQDYGGVGDRIYVTGLNGCYMLIYVDGVRMVAVQRTTKDNLNIEKSARMGIDDFVVASSIRAVEIYPSGSALPAIFNAVNNGCGVVGIWTTSTR